jgi:hypothetical protein
LVLALHSYQEISELLDLALPEVRMRLYHAHQRFRIVYCELVQPHTSPLREMNARSAILPELLCPRLHIPAPVTLWEFNPLGHLLFHQGLPQADHE